MTNREKRAKMLKEISPAIVFGYCEAKPTAIPAVSTQDMETTMNTVPNNDANARKAIFGAIYVVENNVTREAYKTFGYEDIRRPKTAQELVDWIKAGDIILPNVDDPDYDPAEYRYDAFLGLTFPPKIKKDRDGYEKHMENFYKDKKSLELEVQVLEPEKALANFKTFERKWVH